MCRGIISTIDTELLKKAEDAESKLFYLKMKGESSGNANGV